MKKTVKQNLFFGAAAIVSALLALAGFISASGRTGEPQAALLVICSLLLLTLCGLYISIIFLSADREPNYFLYREQQGGNIEVGELTWEQMTARLDRYISEKFGNEAALIKDRAITDDTRFGEDCVFRPLIAYKLLFDMSMPGRADCFEAFECADISAVRTIAHALELAGERDMSTAVMKYKSGAGDAERFCRYLTGNQKYLQSRMLAFVRRNIERFY